MRTNFPINKSKFEQDFVRMILKTDARFTFRHFNNRRYYFNFDNAEADIHVEIVLRVHLKKKYVAAIVQSKSTLNEVRFDKNAGYYQDGFLNRKSFGEFEYNYTKADSLRSSALEIRQSIIVAVEEHQNEIVVSRKGIELAMGYDYEIHAEPYAFPKLYAGVVIGNYADDNYNQIYIQLFKALNMANSKVLDYRIPYVIGSILQLVFIRRGIPFRNGLH